MANNNEMRLNVNEAPVAMMRCVNNNCKKPNIEEPLELFDGALACPSCGSLLNRSVFKVTAYNDSLFKLSQVYYLNYLTAISNKEITSLEGENMVQTAVYYCREASRFGHPEARVKLGFYWEMGYMKKRSGVDRYKMAYRYYEDVLKMKESSVTIEKDEGTQKVTVSEYEDKYKLRSVRKEAAGRLKKMCTSVNVGLSLANLKEEFAQVGVSIEGKYEPAREKSSEESIYNMLSYCGAKTSHPPIFGYFIVSVGQLRGLYLREKRSLKELIRKEKMLGVKWILRDNLFDDKLENDSFYTLTDAESSLPPDESSIDQDTLVLLYFFNGNFEGKNVKNWKLKTSIRKMKASLFRKGIRDSELTDECLSFLSDTEHLNECSGFFSRVFFSDDVYFAWLKNDSHPIKSLGEYLANKEGGRF